MRQRRFGKGGGGEGGAVVAAARTVAEQLVAHDAVIVQRNVGKHGAARHVAHRPNMFFADHAALGIGGDKAALGGGDACVFQRESSGVGLPSNRH